MAGKRVAAPRGRHLQSAPQLGVRAQATGTIKQGPARYSPGPEGFDGSEVEVVLLQFFL